MCVCFKSELSTEREHLTRKSNEMANDIEKLIRHNEVTKNNKYFSQKSKKKDQEVNNYLFCKWKITKKKELLYIQDELRKSGHLNTFSKRNSNIGSILSRSNQNLHHSIDAQGGDQPKPLMFVSIYFTMFFFLKIYE